MSDFGDREGYEGEYDRYPKPVQRSTEITTITDLDGTIRYINSTVEDVLGYRPEEVAGDAGYEYVHPDDRNAVAEAFTMLRANPGEPRTVNVRVRRADRTWCWIEARMQNHLDDDVIDGIVVTGRDVTRRIEREREYLATKEQMQLALEGANLGIWDWDMRTDEVSRDELLTEMLGYTPVEMGDHLRDWERVVHPDGKKRHDEALADHVENRTPYYQCDYRLETKSGEWKWVRTMGKVVERDRTGTPVRAVGIHQDIDDRKRAKLALEEREEKYRTLFESTRDALMLLDRDGFFDCNEQTLELFGVDSVESFVEYAPWELSPPTQPDGTASKDAALAHIDAAFEDGEAFFEWTHRRVDGTTFPAEVKLSRFAYDGDPALHALVRDITERKENERKLKRTRERVKSERDGKEAIRQLMLQTSTDTEIADGICRLLVDAYGYESAWVVRADVDGSDARRMASRGDDHGFRTDVDENPELDAATRRALLNNQSVTVTVETIGEQPLVDRLTACGLHSVHSVPLSHDGISYGALTVVRTEPGSAIAQELVDEVAAALAFKWRVNRQRQGLVAESVVELRIQVCDDDHFLTILSSSSDVPPDAGLQAHELRGDDEAVPYLVSSDDVDPETLATVAEDAADVRETSLVTDDATPVLHLRVVPPTVGSVLTQFGGAIQSIEARDGHVTLTVQFPRRTNVANVVQTVRESWPDVTVQSQRERTVDDDTPSVFDSLTAKQEQALEAATLAGFFDRPQQANASEVAEILDVSRSTFLHHLRRAEQKFFEGAFEDGSG